MKHHVTYMIMLLRNLSSTTILKISPEMLFRISFFRASAFAVPNVEKRGASSKYRKNPAEIPTSGAV
jgi:hypothetical protein